ncbi:hypothetical protein EIN_428950 [Entamoeba invadens IP1]|uniref:Uncharacterized protein n=1 Tax=Entamoeba invadens IP1 TaxID=370355 RepID=A0A0A1UGT9_ENTIV|nr:hypothetical protein EIN_428950 [Entamoeba invadens IP1]ELP95149.1 hypothetical protein EIN_428950 [Entamoeba invadens IP1]|eukprot:XP_004261920.1 hypothetical protein EIN_428950 [Entamoeba invadens IP1]
MSGALFIEKQTSVMTEMVKGEEILVVVKQCNFVLTISSTTLVLEGAEICCELLYDSPELKPVSFINQPPIKYKALQANEHSLNVECKLNVLSSQHEDHFFRVKVTVLIADKPIGEVLSSPIRSISKLDPHKKEMLKKKKERVGTPSTEKKPRGSSLSEEVKLEKGNTLVNLLALLSQNTVLLEKMRQKQCCDEISSLESGFQNFIEKYTQTAGRRRGLLMEVVAGLNDQETQGLDEIASVVDVTITDDRRRPDYNDYLQQNFRREEQRDGLVPPFQGHKPFINYTNPFLR